MYDPAEERSEAFVVGCLFLFPPRFHDHSFFMEGGKTAPGRQEQNPHGPAGHEKSLLYDKKGCTFKTGYQR